MVCIMVIFLLKFLVIVVELFVYILFYFWRMIYIYLVDREFFCGLEYENKFYFYGGWGRKIFFEGLKIVVLGMVW